MRTPRPAPRGGSQAEAIAVDNGGNPLLGLAYSYDVYGNLATRSTDYAGGTTETLGYDDLQRLVSSERVYTAGGTETVSYGYDPSGSFSSKSDYGSLYHYHPNRPHVLTQVDLSGGGTASFAHDANGNLSERDGVAIAYNAFNKPVLIDDGVTQSRFTYGADLQRYRQITVTGATIYYLDKHMEVESAGTAIDFRHYLGDFAVLTKTGDLNDPDPSIDYLFRDRLGSIAVIGDAAGFTPEHRGHDAWGKPRGGNWADRNPPIHDSDITDRGFTDHEHLDNWQLIHMDGRGYDYNLGRFLSIDPLIQAPVNSQSLNPYSYIMNNPLAGVDPSGYCAARTGSHIRDCVVVTVTAINSATRTTSSRTISVNKYNGAEVQSRVSNAIPVSGWQLRRIDLASDGSGSDVAKIGSQSNQGNYDHSLAVQKGPYGQAFDIAAANLYDPDTSFLDTLFYGVAILAVTPAAVADNLTNGVLNVPYNASLAGQHVAAAHQSTSDFDRNVAYLSAVRDFATALSTSLGIASPGSTLTSSRSAATKSVSVPNNSVNFSTAGRSAEEAAAIREYARRSNQYLDTNGPQTIQSTAGSLRGAASAAARAERLRAARAGQPYSGQVGHVPDTAVTGQANPPGGWLNMPGSSNQVCGGALGCRVGETIRGFTVDGVRP